MSFLLTAMTRIIFHGTFVVEVTPSTTVATRLRGRSLSSVSSSAFIPAHLRTLSLELSAMDVV